MDRKSRLSSIVAELHRRRRSLDTLRLLLEEEDLETAHALARLTQMELARIVAELRDLLGLESAGLTSPADTPAVAPREPHRGYLGDSETPGAFERGIAYLIDRLWDLISDPRKVVRILFDRRRQLVSALSIVLLIYAGWKAYDGFVLGSHGLTGEYFLDRDLKNLYATRQDHTISFRWPRRPPIEGFRSENFSIRWTGFLRIETAGSYQFFTVADDGVRLWIDDQLLIDDWAIHAGALDKGTMTLAPGFHRIRLEYFQGEGDMMIKLQWMRPKDKHRSTIPAWALSPTNPRP